MRRNSERSPLMEGIGPHEDPERRQPDPERKRLARRRRARGQVVSRSFRERQAALARILEHSPSESAPRLPSFFKRRRP